MSTLQNKVLTLNVKVMMPIASVLGAYGRILFIAVAKPGYDFNVWLALFALMGVGVGNLALLVLYKIYDWLKT